MKLTDLLPLETWKAFEDDLHARSGREVNVFDTAGICITDSVSTDQAEALAADIRERLQTMLEGGG
ncbi:MAG: hypothetical protein JEZ11_02700 [Desulfobacterales bacterium]|nr:hypothetical protein [Desulfobacterales bacterium]